MVKLSKKKVKTAIDNSFGIMNNIAKRCGCSRIAIWHFINKPEHKEEFHQLIEDEREKMIDIAEGQCIVQAAQGNTAAINLMLLRNKRGRARGYSEVSEVSQFNATEIKISFEEPSNERKEQIIDVEAKEVKSEKQKAIEND